MPTASILAAFGLVCLASAVWLSRPAPARPESILDRVF